MIVVAGAIHGSEGNTATLVEALIARLADSTGTLPDDVSLFLVPRLNPDGLAGRSRDNAHSVDLNRNWDTNNWQASIAGASTESPETCGTSPFSEPETAAFSSWLLSLRHQSTSRLAVIMYHSAYPPSGLIQPGYRIVDGQQVTDPNAVELAQFLAARLGYTYSPTWPDYSITGEAIHWCAENNITCIDIELPSPNDPTEAEVQLHLSTLLDMIQRVGVSTTDRMLIGCHWSGTGLTLSS
jgi:predicted deacylase